MGAAVGVQNPEAESDELKAMRALLNDTAKTNGLFQDMATAVAKTHIGMNSTSSVNVRNVVEYFKSTSHPTMKELMPNKDVVIIAHKHVCERIDERKEKIAKKKNKKKKKKAVQNEFGLLTENLRKEDFHFLMVTIYLYSFVWKLFTIMDKNTDTRITRHEFKEAKEKVKEVHVMNNIDQLTQEEWDNEYTKLDVNGDGAIEYSEMCRYIVKNMKINPEDFFNNDLEFSDDEDEYEDDSDPLQHESVMEAVARMEAEQQAQVTKEVVEELDMRKKDDQLGLVFVKSDEEGHHDVHDLHKSSDRPNAVRKDLESILAHGSSDIHVAKLSDPTHRTTSAGVADQENAHLAEAQRTGTTDSIVKMNLGLSC